MYCTEMWNGDSTPVIDLSEFDGTLMIASPPYPSVALLKSDCHWSFIASDPLLKIELKIIEWEVSTHKHTSKRTTL